MRKAISVWCVIVGRPGHEESCEFVPTARLAEHLSSCDLYEEELDFMMSEVAKVADGGRGVLRTAALTTIDGRVSLSRG